MSLRILLRILTTPSCWIRCAATSPIWDRTLNQLMDEHSFRNIGEFTAEIGGVEVWIANHPYASFSKGYWGRLPSRATVFRAADKLEKDAINERIAAGRCVMSDTPQSRLASECEPDAWVYLSHEYRILEDDLAAATARAEAAERALEGITSKGEALIKVVEGFSTYIDENGFRLKDEKEWCVFYSAIKSLRRAAEAKGGRS